METVLHVWVIFGDIAYDPDITIINEITNVLSLPRSEAERIAEDLLDIYGSYIIPELFEGEVVMKCLLQGEGSDEFEGVVLTDADDLPDEDVPVRDQARKYNYYIQHIGGANRELFKTETQLDERLAYLYRKIRGHNAHSEQGHAELAEAIGYEVGKYADLFKPTEATDEWAKRAMLWLAKNIPDEGGVVEEMFNGILHFIIDPTHRDVGQIRKVFADIEEHTN